ncbi:MAG: RNA polymerase sigma factor [Ignavibacteria bacterium]|nr:RNA polymerase sigma factor [Ignavibacteria bacterium]
MNEKERTLQFQDLIERHKGILLKVARTYCRNETDREDLVQEISIQIWRSMGRYNSEYKISTWLYRISINTAISFYRKHSKRQENTFPLGENTPAYIVENTEKEIQLGLLDKFINELNDFDKALMLLYLEEKSHIEIAEITGITPSNVGTKIGRIKEKIKVRFSKLNKF